MGGAERLRKFLPIFAALALCGCGHMPLRIAKEAEPNFALVDYYWDRAREAGAGRYAPDRMLEAEKLITGDKYLFIRDAYLQRRQFLVTGEVPKDNFGDEDFSE